MQGTHSAAGPRTLQIRSRRGVLVQPGGQQAVADVAHGVLVSVDGRRVGGLGLALVVRAHHATGRLRVGALAAADAAHRAGFVLGGIEERQFGKKELK